MNNDTPADAITQADRDAAASIIRSDETGKLIVSGKLDDMREVQAFARHRTTSLAAQDGLVGLLRESLVKLQDAQGALVPKQYACNLIKRIEATLAEHGDA